MRYLYLIIILSITLFPALSQTDTALSKIETDAETLYREKMYPNGRLMYQGYFRNGNPVGEIKRYYESGAIQAILQYGDGAGPVKARLFFGNGNLAATGNYSGTMKDSIWNYYGYYDQVLILKEKYLEGRRNGPMIHYYNNGSILDSVNWENNIKQGTWVQYFPDRTVRQKGHFRDGRLEGDFIVNLEDGSPYIAGQFKNDMPDGRWIFYNEDGSVNQEMNYVDGKSADENKTDLRQKAFFQMIEENKGKFDEPDETEFMAP